MLITDLPNADKAVGPFAQQNEVTGFTEQVSDEQMGEKYSSGQRLVDYNSNIIAGEQVVLCGFKVSAADLRDKYQGGSDIQAYFNINIIANNNFSGQSGLGESTISVDGYFYIGSDGFVSLQVFSASCDSTVNFNVSPYTLNFDGIAPGLAEGDIEFEIAIDDSYIDSPSSGRSINVLYAIEMNSEDLLEVAYGDGSLSTLKDANTSNVEIISSQVGYNRANDKYIIGKRLALEDAIDPSDAMPKSQVEALLIKPVVKITTDTLLDSTKTYLVNASGGIVVATVPDVVAGDTREYSVMLDIDGNHCQVRTVSGVQLFSNGISQTLNYLEIPTVQTGVIVRANGVDGYDIISDTRPYYRFISVTGDLDLTNGAESQAMYIGNLADAQTAIITIQDPLEAHVGFWAKFTKHSGDNASYIIKTVSGDFEETILDNETGFELTTILDSLGVPQYEITQDSRSKIGTITQNLYPRNIPSVVKPIYNLLQTQSFALDTTISPILTSIDPQNPQSLGFYANDDKNLIGTVKETNINSIANVLVSGQSDDCQIKFRYYSYDIDLDVLTLLSETGYSAQFSNTGSFAEINVTGTLPEHTWATEDGLSNNILVTEFLAIKSTSNRSPTLTVEFGGDTPSKTYLNVETASFNHKGLGGVVEARTGVSDGHVDNNKALQIPELSTADSDAEVTPNGGMKLFDPATELYYSFSNGVWIPDFKSDGSVPVSGNLTVGGGVSTGGGASLKSYRLIGTTADSGTTVIATGISQANLSVRSVDILSSNGTKYPPHDVNPDNFFRFVVQANGDVSLADVGIEVQEQPYVLIIDCI